MSENHFEMRLTGSGGQGVILASIILAEAALRAGKNAVQSQSYGPEARGGMCKAETIVSSSEICFTKVTKPNLLLALNQQSLDKYSKGLPEDCVVVADSSLTIPGALNPKHVVAIPILATARDVVGKAMTANIVAVGAINEALGFVSDDELKEAVSRHVPKGTEELNYKALVEGKNLIAATGGAPRKTA